MKKWLKWAIEIQSLAQAGLEIRQPQSHWL